MGGRYISVSELTIDENIHNFGANCWQFRWNYTHRQYPLGYSVGSRASYWNEFVRWRSFFKEEEIERSVCESVQGLTSIFLRIGIMSKLQRIHERSESCKLSPNEKSGGCVGSTPKACLAIVLNEIPIQVLVRHVVTVAQLLNFFCPKAESNPGPTTYEPSSLPTELPTLASTQFY